MCLLQLLGQWYERGNILVFVDSQRRCDGLFSSLMRAGYMGLSLHGGKDQVDRNAAIDEFKAGNKDVLVATDVAAKGLDFPDIQHVINFTMPSHRLL